MGLNNEINAIKNTLNQTQKINTIKEKYKSFLRHLKIDTLDLLQLNILDVLEKNYIDDVLYLEDTKDKIIDNTLKDIAKSYELSLEIKREVIDILNQNYYKEITKANKIFEKKVEGKLFLELAKKKNIKIDI